MTTEGVQKALALFDRTVWVITASDENRTGGLVATFVNNASLVAALPRLSIGIARHHHTWELIDRSRSFAAHLVDEQHIELIWRFGLASGRRTNKLAGLRWNRGRTGSPVLQDALAWLDCSVEAELNTGDRSIYVAAVLDGGVNRAGAALTSNRVFALATPEQRVQMDADRVRDAELDAAAILAWRARTK